MYRINQIVKIDAFLITCKFNTGEIKKIDLEPIISNHIHLNGIEKLKEKFIFDSVAIGEMGEIFWKDLITNNGKEKWNYDLSPEFVFFNSIAVNP